MSARTLGALALVVNRDDAFAFRELRIDTDRAEKAANTRGRQKALPWLSGLRSKRGVDLALSVALCGRYCPATGAVSGTIGVVQLTCKNRWCPCCQQTRSKKLGHKLRRAMEFRLEQMATAPGITNAVRCGGPAPFGDLGCEDRERPGRCSPIKQCGFTPAAAVDAMPCDELETCEESRILFVTLTPRKLPHSQCSAEEAIARLKGAWRALSNSDRKRGREFKTYFAGGVRTIETTYPKKGDKFRSKDGTTHEVKYDGFHVHLHMLIELGPGVNRDGAEAWIRRNWTEVIDADPNTGQAILPMDLARVHQLCKYAAKPPADVADSINVQRELFHALESVRLLEGFGTWRSWKKWVEDDDEDEKNEPLLLARGVMLGDLEKATRRADSPTLIEFKGWVGGVEQRRVERAVVVWEAIKNDNRTFQQRWDDARNGRGTVGTDFAAPVGGASSPGSKCRAPAVERQPSLPGSLFRGSACGVTPQARPVSVETQTVVQRRKLDTEFDRNMYRAHLQADGVTPWQAKQMCDREERAAAEQVLREARREQNKELLRRRRLGKIAEANQHHIKAVGT